MSSASVDKDRFRKQVIDFQVASIAEWNDPAGKNVDMIKLAYHFADEAITALKQELKQSLEAHIHDAAKGVLLERQLMGILENVFNLEEEKL